MGDGDAADRQRARAVRARPIGPVAVSPWTTSTTLASVPWRSATICAKPG